ncbi:MAG: hypothetical protein JXR96_14240 [Deltaproteobacteria bacterium]|nr:hypothetical protein [Deltaproteobacteria bacterium]
MRAGVSWILLASLAFSCGDGTEGDRCAGVLCDQPPENTCLDGSTLRKYHTPGDCAADTGACVYGFSDEHCDHGCVAGRCMDEDRCRGIVCDEPEDNYCRDDSTLVQYEAIGDCVPETGACVYDSTEKDCQYGCQSGRCLDEDPCDGVICDQSHKPADTCKDESTLLSYGDTGTCDPSTGRCRYDSTELPCEHGCADGRCLGEKPVWGWVSVLELHSAVLNAPWFWNDGLRAIASEEAHWTRTLDHQLEVACTEVMAQGACSYFECEQTIPFWFCEPSCAWATEDCVQEGEQYVCRDMPANWDMGTISITGLAQDVQMTPDEDRFYSANAPAELFDQGDSVSVASTGGDLEPFSLETTGVATLVIDSNEVDLYGGEPATISWTPADSSARIVVLLESGHHFPSLPEAVIRCDVQDIDGQVEIPASFVDAFLQTDVATRSSHITRYHRETQTVSGGQIEFFLGSVQGLRLGLFP